MAYTAGAGIFTPEGFAQALEQFGASIMPAVLRAANRVKAVPRSIALAKFRSQGVGKGIFAPKGGGYLLRARAIARGSQVVIAVEARGFAALQEQGGHTKPPRKGAIYPANRKALRLKVPSIGDVIVASARHRGARIKRQPFLEAAMIASQERVRQELDREISKFKYGGVAIASSSLVA